MGKLKVTITMSLDGFVAGPHQSRKEPLGIGGEQLHQWLVPLKAFREGHGEQGGEVNASTPIAEGILGNVGATIMGRNMFGGGPGPWGDDPWKGYWGDDPPYHSPVFVLTSPTASSPRSSKPELPLRRRTCRSAAAPTSCSSISRPACSTRFSSRWFQSSLVAAHGCSTTSVSQSPCFDRSRRSTPRG